MSRKIVHIENVVFSEQELLELLNMFDDNGQLIGSGYRNVIKILAYKGINYNIKSFKKPNLINKLAYRFFRKSKAQRSFEYAKILLSKSIKTPEPVAYIEYTSLLKFENSFYISKQLDYDFTIRRLIDEPDFPDYENLLRQFTNFTFKLHEQGVHFLDHSPGNTLIKKNKDSYSFYLVDLNRMRFEDLDFDNRMKNFARLSPKQKMLDIISDEYATLIDYPVEKVRSRMLYFSDQFSSRFKRKENFKKKYFFWRSK